MCINGSKVISSKNAVFHFLKNEFFLANSVDPDKMHHHFSIRGGVCTICKSIRVGVSGPEMVKKNRFKSRFRKCRWIGRQRANLYSFAVNTSRA